MDEKKIPTLDRVKTAFATVEKRANISIQEYLAFNSTTNTIKHKHNSDWHYYYYGGLNEDGKEHGRGIKIFWSDEIEIGYYEDGGLSVGNYIWIRDDGSIKVGERYLKDGAKWNRGT